MGRLWEDPTTILARGSAFQAARISSIRDSEAELREAFSRETKMNEVKATTHALGARRRARKWEES